MRTFPMSDARRLHLLNMADTSHAWNSCRERRSCILCDRVFSGYEIRLSWFRRGVIRLRCPTLKCTGGPATWVHPGDPLVSEKAWEDWERIIRETEATAS